MLVANGGSRKDRSAALAALQKEQREAEVAKHEMERVAAEVANTLQGINEQIKALSSAVKKAEGRLAQNQADAPEG
jgi:predicted  nucleic acid-binding Zn-ribbon protein